MTTHDLQSQLAAIMEALSRARSKPRPCEACDGTGYTDNGRCCGRFPCAKCGGTGGRS